MRTTNLLGHRAPDITFQGERGEPLVLAGLWMGTERGVVVAFLRHYG